MPLRQLIAVAHDLQDYEVNSAAVIIIIMTTTTTRTTMTMMTMRAAQ